jgi:hypothetical protein
MSRHLFLGCFKVSAATSYKRLVFNLRKFRTPVYECPLIFKEMSSCIKIKLIVVENHRLPNSLIKNPLLSD